MSINLLMVEGKLDSEILIPLFRGSPTVQRGGSKNGLKPQARYERVQNGVIAGYLRDRDFDFESPEDLNAATIDSSFQDNTWMALGATRDGKLSSRSCHRRKRAWYY